MSKDLWIAEYERIGEDLAGGEIEEAEARSRLKALGFDRGEIEDHIAAWQEDMA